MNSLHRVAGFITRTKTHYPIFKTHFNFMSTKSRNDDDKWNDAWESAWLPEDLTDKTRAPWETDVNFPSPVVIDVEAKAFVEDMNEHWDERRGKSGKEEKKVEKESREEEESSLYSLESMKKDYRLKKQRVHASLWVYRAEFLDTE